MVYKSKPGFRKAQKRQIRQNQQDSQQNANHQQQSSSVQASFPNSSISHQQIPRGPQLQNQLSQNSTSTMSSQVSTSSISSVSSAAASRHNYLSRGNNSNFNPSSCQAELRSRSSFHGAYDSVPSPAMNHHTTFSKGRLMRSQTFYNPSTQSNISGKQSRIKIKNLEHVYDVNEQRIQHLERMVDQLTSELRRQDISSDYPNSPSNNTSSAQQNNQSKSSRKKKLPNNNSMKNNNK